MADTEKSRRRKQKTLEELRPIDDIFMRALFKDENKRIMLVQNILRIILKMEDLEVEEVDTQADMKQIAGARSILLDVYARDGDGIRYNIEVQRSDSGAEIHRARYHSSIIDAENLKPGQDFDELPETYVIFITENDIFRDGQPLRWYVMTDRFTGDEAGDGVNRLYVNGKYQCNDDEKDALGWLMHDFTCADPHSMHYNWLADRSKDLKESPEGVEYMYGVMEKYGQECAEEQSKRTLEISKALLKGISEEELIKKGYTREEILWVWNFWNSDQPLNGAN